MIGFKLVFNGSNDYSVTCTFHVNTVFYSLTLMLNNLHGLVSSLLLMLT